VANIIVIDDEPDARDSIKLTLEAAGHRVRTAADGIAGLEECRADVPDLVLTDLIMPRLHGFDVVAELRRAAPTSRIIAISGGGNFATLGYQPESVTTAAYLAAALEMGADAILHKPFSRRDLLGAIERCLSSPGTHGA
jgi:DNA-binding response OmpR family regulator